MKIIFLIIVCLFNASNAISFSFSNSETQKYDMSELSEKYNQKIPMNFEEIKSYALFKELRSEEKKYFQSDLDQKYNQNIPMTLEEIHSYCLLRGLRNQEISRQAQAFWIINFIGMNILGPLFKYYMIPFFSDIITKYKFKKILNTKKSNINFNSVVGYESVKTTLKPIIENLKNQKKFKKLEKIDGLLLYGPPGCGKTHFVKALANEIGIPIISILIKDLIEEGGLITHKIDLLFEVLVNYTSHSGPVILFLDEIDFLMGNREGKEKIDQNIKLVLQNFLDKLDGEKELKGIFVVGCTNFKDQLDPALLRSGRMGTLIEIKQPAIEDIIELIKVKTKQSSIIFSDKEITILADTFIGLSVTEIIKQLRIIIDNKKLNK